MSEKEFISGCVSVASLTVVTMATLTEFYLTTVWDYKPNVVNQIIDGLFELECVSFLGFFLKTDTDHRRRTKPNSPTMTSTAGSE